MAGFDLEMQRGGQLTGGIRVECSDVSFAGGEVSQALPTRLTQIWGASVNVIAGDNTLDIVVAVAKDVSDNTVTLKRLGADDVAAGTYTCILMGV